MYNETNSNRDGPWFGSGDVATRTSNVGFDEISSVPSVSRTYVSTGTSTSTRTSTAGGGTGAGSRNVVSGVVVGLAAAVVGVVSSAL